MSSSMITRLLQICVCVLAFAALSLSAQAGFYDATQAQIAQPPGTLIRAQTIGLPAFYRAKAWRILYATRDYAGNPIAASGVVVQSTVRPVGPRGQTIVAWAHSTVGTAQGCAPSLRQQPTQFILGLNDMISAGYITVATDYPGLGTVGPVGYLIGKGQAYAVLDSVRAAARLPGVKAARDYGVYGFSQGGHAAIFSGLVAPQYMPEFNLKAIAAVAPPSDLLKLFSYNATTVEGKVLVSYVMQSWAIKYGLSLREVLSDAAIQTVFRINSICVDDFSGSLDAYKAQGSFGADMFLGNPLHHPLWRQRLIENSASTWPTKVPLMVVQGSSDSIVHPEVTEAALSATCLAGGNVNYVSLSNRSHSGSAKDGIPKVTAWLIQRLNGVPNVNSCSSRLIAQIGDGSRR